MDANLMELLARMEHQRSDRCSYDSAPAIHICGNPKCSAILCRKCILRSSELLCQSCEAAHKQVMVERLSKPPVVESASEPEGETP